MAYNQQAFGVTLGLTINDVEARKSLQNLRREMSNLDRNMRHNASTFARQGKYTEMYTQKYADLKKYIEKTSETIKEYEKIRENSANSDKVSAQQVKELDSKLDKLYQTRNVLNGQYKETAVQIASNKGELQELNHSYKERIGLIDATSERMELEGKRFGALRMGAEKFNETIKKSTKEIRLQNQALRELEEKGLKDSSEYKSHQVALEKAHSTKLEAQQGKAEYEEKLPVEYVKIRRDNEDVGEHAKYMKASHSAQSAEVEALRTTGNSSEYESAKVNARVKRMKELSEQIDKEQDTLSKKASDTVFGNKVRENIAKMQKEYGKLEDEQRRYSEGLDGLNRKNQKQFALMKSNYQTLEATGNHFKAQIAEADALRKQVNVLNDQREKETKELDALGKKYGKQSDEYLDQSKKVSSLNKSLVNYNRRIKEINKSTGGAYGAMSKFSDMVSRNQQKFDHIGNALTKAGHGLTVFSGGIGLAIGEGTKLNYDLDKTNTYTKSLLQTAGGESNSEIAKNLAKAKKDNIELSEQYGIAQNDIAKTQQDLAHRGYESNQMLQATKPLVEGAIATGYKLSDVTNNATGAMEAFGLRSKDSKTMFDNTKKSINAMAYASDMSSSSFNETGLALSYVGPTAHTAKMSLEDTASAIGQLSLSHIKGQRAGTGLRKMLDSLISPTKAGQAEMEKLGIKVNDASGKMRPLKDIMGDFHEKLKGLSESQQVNIEHKIFGTTGQASAGVLIQNADALGKFTKKVKEANGNDYIGGLSKKKMDTPIEQIHRLQRSWEQFTMSLAGDLAPALNTGIKGLTSFLDKINNASPLVKKMFDAFAIGVPILALVLTPLGSIIRNIHTITGAWNSFSGLFSSKVRGDKRRIDSMNESLAEQNRLLAERKNLINGTGEVSGFNETGTGTGGSGGSSSGGGSTLEKAEKAGKEEKELSSVERAGKVGRWTKLKSRFGGVAKTGTRWGKVGKVESLAETGLGAEQAVGGTGKLFSKFRGLGKIGKLGKSGKMLGKIAKIGGKGVIGLDVLSSMTDLIGTNKHNVGHNVGSASGSLIGTGLGSAIGSVVPGAGTVVGGAVGGYLGEKVGGWSGDKIGHYIGKRTRNADYNQRKSIDKVDKKTDGAGSTLESLRANERMINGLSGTGTNKELINQLNKSNGSLVDKLSKSLDKKKKTFNKESKNDAKTLNNLLGKGTVSKTQAKHEKDAYSANVNKAKKDLNLVKDNKNGKHSDLFLNMIGKDLSNVYKKDSRSNVFAQLSATGGKYITDKEAGRLIAQSNSIRNKDIGNAKSDYKKATGKADKDYNNNIDSAYRAYQTGTISKKTYNEAINKAKSNKTKAYNKAKNTRDKAIKNANNGHKAVVKQAKKETKDHLASVNEKNGKQLGFWARTRKGIGRGFTSAKNTVGKWGNNAKKTLGKWGKGAGNALGGLGKKVAKPFVGMYKTVQKPFNNVTKSVRHNLGKWGKEFAGWRGRWHKRLSGWGKSIGHVTSNIGKGIGKAIGKVGRKIGGWVKGHITKPFSKAFHGISKVVTGIFKGVSKNINKWFKTVGKRFTKWFKKAKKTLSKLMKPIVNFVKDAIGGISNAFSKTFGFISDTFHTVVDGLTKGFKWIVDELNKSGVVKVIKSVGDVIGDVVDGIGKLADAIKNTIGKWFGKVKDGIGTALHTAGKFIGGLGHWLNGYAKGGEIKKDETALVNEEGDESVYNPEKGTFRVFSHGMHLEHLKKGDRVLTASDTKKLLKGTGVKGKSFKGHSYANGTGSLRTIKGTGLPVSIYSSDDELKDAGNESIKTVKKLRKGILHEFDIMEQGVNDRTKKLVQEFGSNFGDLPKLTHDSIKKSIDEINKGFSGVNSTLNQFGSKKDILKPIHYANGSDGAVAKEHDAIVNDARHGNQQEAIIRHDGIFLPKFKDALVHLNKGDAVLNGRQTRDLLRGTGIAHYANGSGVSDKELSKLIDNAKKHPLKQLNSDFDSNVKSNGSTLSQGYTDDVKNALDKPMGDWYSAVFDVLSRAKDYGIDLDGMKKTDLIKLVKGQLGKKRLEYVADKLSDLTHFAGTIPTKYHAQLLAHAGIPESDWADYNYIITRESGWNPKATNPNGGAYGLPQSLPANKMASAGSDWRTNPITQLKWQKAYIMGRYGSAGNARAYWQAHHNYENGGLITQEQIARVGEHNKPEMILPLTDKYRTVQLAQKAVDFVNRNNGSSSTTENEIKSLNDRFNGLSKDISKAVDLLAVIAQQSNEPIKAYITEREMFTHINNRQKKENMQSAMRRGEPLV